jgi:OmcA/MtrC family decaheme c-type cytochrome
LWAGRIADGSVKRAEIAVMPKLQVAAVADNAVLALDAPSRTFVLGSKVLQPPVADTASIVKVAGGCNACHDALATTFHATSGGRGGNIVVCRLCHNTRSGGSHLEMQSRSIDSYVHAIHSFQAFDVKNIDFTDPVEAERYDIHVEHVYPNFTILNCESCHNAGKYNVPDQSKSLPGVLSASNDNIIGWNRKIDSVPSYVVGPASRACGACHRAEKIKEDDAIGLAAFNSHTSKPNGYFYEGGSAALDEVINEIMNYWEDGIVLAH